MIGEYNINFLIAALVLLSLIALHFRRQKKLNNKSTRVFGVFLVLAITDVILDLLRTLLIVSEVEGLAEVTRVILTIFYLMQAMFPYFIVYYTQTLRRTRLDIIQRAMKFWAIAPILMCAIILVNFQSETLFGFDSVGRFFEGPVHLIMYIYALAYAGIVLFICIAHHREFVGKGFQIVMEFLAIEGICVTVQALNEQQRMTGFGISLGMLVLYLTISNPHIFIDDLTGSFNKQYFSLWMREQEGFGKPVHVILIDAVDLNQINKVFGRSMGDRVLRHLAEELQKSGNRPKVFRISGKRFLLVLETLAEYERCRNYVQKIFEKPFEIKGEQIQFSAALCGIMNSESLGGLDSLFAYLEYMAGLASGSEETILIQSDDQSMKGFLYEQEVESFLGTAIEEDRFEVYYQPVHSLKNEGFISLEALSRLYHPKLGYVPPDVFISVAEKNGQIAKISELQFRRLCTFLKENKGIMEKVHNVKFNLSPLELMKFGHSQTLIDMIREFDLPFSWFQFEITETAATEYSESLYQMADDFQKGGIGLCLDDFGSGYANINTVMKLPFSAIKLDRSLLHDVVQEPQAADFYKNIVEVLQNMGYQVIAEGAETQRQVEMLHSWNVDMIQGYYYSKPVSWEEIVKLLQAG